MSDRNQQIPGVGASSALEVARERTIRVLTDHFADDTLSVEEFESRLDRMYQAKSPQELDSLLLEVEHARGLARRDVPGASQSGAPADALASHVAASRALSPYDPDADVAPAPRRLVAFMSSTRRTGRWRMPRRFEVMAIMADAMLDLRDVTLAAGVCDIEVLALMSNVEILVPPGVIVEDGPLSIMSNVENAALDDGRMGADAPRIRINGTAVMANVEIRVGPPGLPTKKAWKQGRQGR